MYCYAKSRKCLQGILEKKMMKDFNVTHHGLRTPREEIAFTARPKIQSQSQIFRYGGSIFCLPHRPNFSDIFDLCLHWVSVVRVVDKREYQKVQMKPTDNLLCLKQVHDGLNLLLSSQCISWLPSKLLEQTIGGIQPQLTQLQQQE